MVTGVFLVTVNELTTGVLLLFFSVAYVGAVNGFGLRCIVDSDRFMVFVTLATH
jgi:hypothetical protein